MRATTLNIEESCVKLVTTNGKRVMQWSSSPLPDGLVKKGVITDPPTMAAHIKALLKQQGAPRGKVIVCVSGVRYVPRVLTVPKIKRQLRQEAIRHESERQMPVPLDQLYLSWQQLGGDGSRDRYFVLGVPQGSVNAQVSTLTQAGVRKYSLDFKPVALARTVNFRESVILNLERSSADIVIVAEGVPLIIRNLQFDQESTPIEEMLGDISTEVVQTIDYHNSTHPDRPLDPQAPVYLTGGLSRDRSAKSQLTKSIGAALKPVNPLLDCPLYMPVEEYAVNIGLALSLVMPREAGGAASSPATNARMNEDYYPAPKKASQKLIAVGIAVLALALLAPISQVRSQVQEESQQLAQELAVMDEQLRELVKATSPLENLIHQVDLLQQERQIVLGASPRFAERLDTMLGGVPDDMSPDSLKMTEDAVIMEGDAVRFSQVIDFAAQLENTGLFSAVHLESLVSRKSSEMGQGTTFRIRAKR